MQANQISLTAFPGRVYWFLLLLVVSAAVFHADLTAVVNLSLNDARYTYVAVIPFVSVALVLIKRKAIFDASRYCLSLGIPLLAAGIVISAGALSGKTNNFSAVIGGIVIVWVAGFVLLLGPKAFWIARFPLALLLLVIPLPATALDHVTIALQNSSAYMSAILFRAIGVPILWQGLVFSLPGFDIQIAPQCSGIRSSISLVIVSGLAGYLFLQSAMRRLLLVAVTVPLVILKNAIRIVTLSTLALYVDQGFLHGNLHHYGGLCFSVLDVAIVLPLLLKLRKSEPQITIPSGERHPLKIEHITS